ncbi:cytochrome c oxidase subunit 3 [Ramlibacter sp. MMS24-I3-19]|uniref:cytochrome c oxidase subunit 3 n=1 Tax=Ramlibacter sp. MMS24-I3-19 TaxID=3416606 RepID=UPI003D07F43D
MTIGLVFLSLLMGAIVWWLFRQTIHVQPWQAQAAAPGLPGVAATSWPPARMALWVFLAVASSLFVLFISAYAMRLSLADWSPLPRPQLLMVNTGVLVLASLAMEWTAHATRRPDRQAVQRGLWASGALTAAFVVGQLVVWRQFHASGFVVASSAASAFFYLLTGVHGVHVLGGLVAWGRAFHRVRTGADAAKVRLVVDLCATYWHFLLAVWVVLYALLVSDSLGLAICSASNAP